MKAKSAEGPQYFYIGDSEALSSMGLPPRIVFPFPYSTVKTLQDKSSEAEHALYLMYLVPSFFSEKGRLETMLERCSFAFKRTATCTQGAVTLSTARCNSASGGDRRSSKDRLVKFESESQNGAPFICSRYVED